MAQINYNPQEHEPDNGGEFELIPKGDYDAVIVASEIKETKAGNGHYLKLEVEILGPTHNGRKIWEQLNIDNPNKVAVEIANRQLRSICDAVGMGNQMIRDSEELHDRPLVVRIKHETYEGEQKNFVAGWKSSGGASAPASSAPAPSAPASSSPAASSPAASAPAASAPDPSKPWLKG